MRLWRRTRRSSAWVTATSTPTVCTFLRWHGHFVACLCGGPHPGWADPVELHQPQYSRYDTCGRHVGRPAAEARPVRYSASCHAGGAAANSYDMRSLDFSFSLTFAAVDDGSTEPEHPGEPTDSDETGNTENPEESFNPEDFPYTGDDANLGVWAVVLCVSVGALLVVLCLYRRNDGGSG